MLSGKLRLEGYPMVSNLYNTLNIPVIADNDGRLSILGEANYDKTKDNDWAVSITLGTGVGSGVLLDSRILRDPHLQFGTQASHVVQQSNSDRLCITWARGTANILCSASALAIIARDGLASGLPSELNDRYAHDPSTIDFEVVLDATIQGDALCLDALETWKKALGWFLVNVVHMYSPQIIIIGGGATSGALYYLEEVRTHVRQHAFRYPPNQEVLIELSDMPDYGVVKGAAALAWDAYLFCWFNGLTCKRRSLPKSSLSESLLFYPYIDNPFSVQQKSCSSCASKVRGSFICHHPFPF